jgi:hypothetical protein
MQYRICILLSLFLFQMFVGTSSAVTQDEIKTLVETRYRITKPSFFGDFKEIGTVLVVQKEGLRANRPSKVFTPNVINGHQVVTVGGGNLPLGGSLDPDLKTGARLHLYGVRCGDDFVELDIFTVKTFVVAGSGTRGPTPLQASTRFVYDEGLAAVTADRVLDDIRAWFKAEGEAGPVVEPRQAGDAGATRTIRSGQSPEEVVAILGAPGKIFVLGAKTIFVYRDIKVIFIDGKVADAE